MALLRIGLFATGAAVALHVAALVTGGNGGQGRFATTAFFVGSLLGWFAVAALLVVPGRRRFEQALPLQGLLAFIVVALEGVAISKAYSPAYIGQAFRW